MTLAIDIFVALALLLAGLLTLDTFIGPVLIFASGVWTMFLIHIWRKR